MLLNRKLINRVTKWFAIFMAAVFALSITFVSGKAGNIFEGCSRSSSTSGNSNVDSQVKYYTDLINQNPQDKDSMLALASLYAQDSVGQYSDAINWFNKYLQIDPQNVDVRIRMGAIYLKMNDANSAVSVLTDATRLAPTNANAFMQLGVAARQAGQNQTAIAAWNTFLQLAPNDPSAPAVKNEIATLAAAPAQTPTTAAAPAPGAAAPAAPAP